MERLSDRIIFEDERSIGIDNGESIDVIQKHIKNPNWLYVKQILEEEEAKDESS